MDIYIKKDKNEAFILNAKIFNGRKPYYLPWVELFNIENQLNIDGDTQYYFNSPYEKQLIKLFSNFLDPAGRIFVEYYTDPETLYGLESGFPPAITRLGYIMFENDFTWFKDWYFPEGFMEGGQKLQGEKTHDNKSKKRQITERINEIESFLEKNDQKNEYYEKMAVERANKILKKFNP